jgi:hypothetical protein|tara:strand:+ start:95 stop:517 length:423 start_codon:yes stop_codon:yes gene_type:complete
MNEGLKLIALDEEQLIVLSSLTQDSIIKANEIGYDKKSKRFAILMNRFRHEEEEPSRVRSAMHFDYVSSIKTLGIDIDSNEDILVLLAVRFKTLNNPGGSIYLEFSNNKSLALTVENIEGFLTDVGKPWLIRNKPDHEKD